MIKWKSPRRIASFKIIHSNKIKNIDWGYFEIVEYANGIQVYIKGVGDFRLDDGELHSVEDAKALCQDYLSKVKL